jgi:hypothetical protein
MPDTLFDLTRGEQLKKEGMEQAVENRGEIFDLAVRVAKELAKLYGQITTDDVYEELLKWDFNPAMLGASAGSIFKGKQWICVGWRKSTRASNHARMIRVWRLKS